MVPMKWNVVRAILSEICTESKRNLKTNRKILIGIVQDDEKKFK